MKKSILLFSFLFSISISFAQWLTPNTSYGTRQNGIMADSAMLIPTGCNAPDAFRTNYVKKDRRYRRGAFYYDTCNAVLYAYNPKDSAWASFSAGGSSTPDTFLLNWPLYADTAKNIYVSIPYFDSLYGRLNALINVSLLELEGDTLLTGFTTYKYGGIRDTASPKDFKIDTALPGESRVDMVVVNAPSNTLDTIKGVPDSFNAVARILPDTCILVAYVNVFGSDSLNFVAATTTLAPTGLLYADAAGQVKSDPQRIRFIEGSGSLIIPGPGIISINGGTSGFSSSGTSGMRYFATNGNTTPGVYDPTKSHSWFLNNNLVVQFGNTGTGASTAYARFHPKIENPGAPVVTSLPDTITGFNGNTVVKFPSSLISGGTPPTLQELVTADPNLMNADSLLFFSSTGDELSIPRVKILTEDATGGGSIQLFSPTSPAVTNTTKITQHAIEYNLRQLSFPSATVDNNEFVVTNDYGQIELTSGGYGQGTAAFNVNGQDSDVVKLTGLVQGLATDSLIAIRDGMLKVVAPGSGGGSSNIGTATGASLNLTSGNVILSGSPTIDYPVSINRTYTTNVNAHGFGDLSNFNTSTAAYASFDSRLAIGGGGTNDHYAGFQAKATINSGTTLTNYYGYLNEPINNGTITNYYPIKINPGGGSGTYTNVEAISIGAFGSTGYAIRALGGRTHFAGVPVASANYPQNAFGNGAFDGSTSGFFVGSTNGTVVGINSPASYNGHLLQVQNGGVPVMSVTGGGLVGIGIVAASSKLQVHNSATSSLSAIQITNGSTGSNSSSGLHLRVTAGNLAELMYLSAASLSLGTNGSNRITLGGSGGVSFLTAENRLYTATATSITLGNSNNTVNVTATGQTITLPSAASISGRQYTIKLTASGSATVATTSSQTIDGSTTYSLSAQYKYVTVVSDGANWIVISNN